MSWGGDDLGHYPATGWDEIGKGQDNLVPIVRDLKSVGVVTAVERVIDSDFFGGQLWSSHRANYLFTSSYLASTGSAAGSAVA